MIVVTTGTNEQPFDRLVRAAATIAGDEALLVQYGSSREPHGRGTWVDFLPFTELEDAMRRARVVVCHAGVGSIMLARRCGKVPIVVPRRMHAGEAVDDHQRQLAVRLASVGVVRLVEDERDLSDVVAGNARTTACAAEPLEAGTLVSELHGFFAERASRAEEWTGSDPLTETACGS
jgi:UDP-N-acetylglucosamine transferase subunit ALG13